MKGRDALVLAGLFCVVAALVAALYLFFNRNPQSVAVTDAARERPAPEQAVDPNPAPEPPVENSLTPVIVGNARSGRGLFDSAPPRAETRPAQNTPAPEADAGSELSFDEKEFLRVHGAEIRAYHAKMGRIARLYYARHRVVRDVDRAFGRLPRYMAVKHAYQRDDNPFKFARDAIALPEVRGEIKRWLGNPQAWLAALGMINQTLRDPPPQDVYRAAQEFMDAPDMADYLKEFTADASKHSDAMRKAVAQGADTSSLNQLMRDLAPGAVPGAAPAQQPR